LELDLHQYINKGSLLTTVLTAATIGEISLNYYNLLVDYCTFKCKTQELLTLKEFSVQAEI